MHRRYLSYGETEWRKQATEALSKMNIFDAQTQKDFHLALDWLHEHAVRCC